jgi:surface polysaccharide O-acyltransferase-like enzyme
MVILVHVTFFPYKFTGAEITGLDIANWFSADAFAAVGYLLGLPIFVLLSGALLLDDAKAEEPMRVFYKKRFNRIGVPLLVWSIIYLLWTFGVKQWPLTVTNFTQKILDGPYYHMWYLYLLIGLYAVTPMLRVLVKHMNHRMFTVLLAIWFVGTLTPAFIQNFTGYEFYPVMFIITGWVGYYLLGTYLLRTKIRRSLAAIGVTVGFLGAFIGAWVITATMGEANSAFFANYQSYSIIIGSTSAFSLLISINPKTIERHIKINRVINWVGSNTLPIYLLQPIIFDLIIDVYSALPINGIRLIYTPTLTLTLLILTSLVVYAIKKIPYASKVIG